MNNTQVSLGPLTLQLPLHRQPIQQRRTKAMFGVKATVTTPFSEITIRNLCLLLMIAFTWPASGDDFEVKTPVEISPTKTYFSKLTQAQVESAPAWEPGMKLPFSFPKAIRIARHQLASLTDDEHLWYVSEISVGSHYTITLCKNSLHADYHLGVPVEGLASIPISNLGVPGKIIPAPSLSDAYSSLPYVARLNYEPDGNAFAIHRGMEDTNVLDRRAILHAPAWEPSAPLPLSIKDALTLARKALATYVADATSWELFSWELKLLPGTTDRWYHSFYFVLPAGIRPVRTASGEAVLLVTMDGVVSKIEPLYARRHPSAATR
jgi:hypothetical protein